MPVSGVEDAFAVGGADHLSRAALRARISARREVSSFAQILRQPRKWGGSPSWKRRKGYKDQGETSRAQRSPTLLNQSSGFSLSRSLRFSFTLLLSSQNCTTIPTPPATTSSSSAYHSEASVRLTCCLPTRPSYSNYMEWYESFFPALAGSGVVYALLYQRSRLDEQNLRIVAFDLFVYLLCGGLVTTLLIEPCNVQGAFAAGAGWQGSVGGFAAGTELRVLKQLRAQTEEDEIKES